MNFFMELSKTFFKITLSALEAEMCRFVMLQLTWNTLYLGNKFGNKFSDSWIKYSSPLVMWGSRSMTFTNIGPNLLRVIAWIGLRDYVPKYFFLRISKHRHFWTCWFQICNSFCFIMSGRLSKKSPKFNWRSSLSRELYTHFFRRLSAASLSVAFLAFQEL